MKNSSQSSRSKELENLEEIKRLLQYNVALELRKQGATMQKIASHLHISNSKVVDMFKGVKHEHHIRK